MKSSGLTLVYIVFLMNFFSSVWASPDPGVFSLEDYLSQVKGKNTGVKGSLLSSQASQLRSTEGQGLLSPTLYGSFQESVDSKLTPFSFLAYDNIQATTFSLGVSQLTTFGLQAKLHYDVIAQQYNNPVLAVNLGPISANSFQVGYMNASPILELTQSLWSNGFGRSTRANQELLQAQALASSYGSSFQARSALAQAEVAYWRISVARQMISVQLEALDRAKKIYEWNERRANLHLGDESDVLQAQALVQSRELDLMASRNEERSAARAFNSARNMDSEVVNETLTDLSPDYIDHISLPKRGALRDDVKAAEQNSKAAGANSVMSLERDLPTFEVYGLAAFNGQSGNLPPTNLGSTLGYSFQPNRPSYMIGLRFSVPLALGIAADARESWRQEKVAAELTYDRKLFEQEQIWKDLNQNLAENKQHLELSQKLEAVQKAKLTQEKERLNRGRTTTYQVLLFEQDYLLSQLGRIRDQSSVLSIIAQMKLFGESL